jgi:hypothetical protein
LLQSITFSNLLTHSMELSPSWEAPSCSVTQEFLNILWYLKVSLPCSPEPTIGPFHKPDESSPYHPIVFPKDPCLYYHLCPGLPSDLLPSGFSIKTLFASTSRLCMLHMLFISSPMTSSFYLAMSLHYETPHYAVFFSILLFCPSLVQIFSAPCSQIPIAVTFNKYLNLEYQFSFMESLDVSCILWRTYNLWRYGRNIS